MDSFTVISIQDNMEAEGYPAAVILTTLRQLALDDIERRDAATDADSASWEQREAAAGEAGRPF